MGWTQELGCLYMEQALEGARGAGTAKRFRGAGTGVYSSAGADTGASSGAGA